MAAVAFTTRNAAGLERYLAAHGVKAELPLKAGEFGVRDPEGNLVIFVQSGSNKVVAKAPPSPNATSKRIIHVGFIVRDAAKEDAFWRDILGFHPYWHGGRTEQRTDWQSIQVPDGTDWLEYMLNISPTPTLKEAGVQDHFSLGVTHMSDAVAALTICTTRTLPGWNSWSSLPLGNLAALLCWVSSRGLWKINSRSGVPRGDKG
jgi:catechol 2,3-dioxygenase-like lactoylglutathione lyase family enzyme